MPLTYVDNDDHENNVSSNYNVIFYYYYYFAIVDVKGKRLLKKATLRGIGDVRGEITISP